MDTQGRTRRLFGKLFLFITPVFILLSAVGVYLLTQEQQRRATEHLATSLGNSSARVGAAISRLETRMPESSPLRDDLAEELLFTLMGDLSIRCAQLEVAGNDNVLMAPQGVGCRVKSVEETLTLGLNGTSYGPLTVGYTQAPIREAAILQRWYALLIMVGAITLALLSGWFAFRVIVGRPLDRMVESLVDAKNAAESANVSKSRFLANMSHEIRTPLNGMIGTAELLEDSSLDSRQKRAIQTISTSGQALLKIIQDVLDYSKIESHTLALHETQFSLYDLVYDVSEMFGSMIGDKPVDICVDYPAGKRRSFLGGEGRLRQVLVNLLGNAVKFTDAGNITVKITIADTLGRSNVQISVRDTGIGIRKEHLNSIFSPFTQADDSTTRKYGGTGLGLAITRELVGLMGGKLMVNSQFGRGSTFEISLPLAHGRADQSPDQELKLLKQRTARHPRVRTLAIGATPASIDAVSDYFSASGWSLEASDADAAIPAIEAAIVSRYRFGVFLIDASLPEHIRDMISQALKAQPETAGVPIIALIAATSRSPKADSLQSVDAYVTKPLRADMLINKMVDRLETREQKPEVLDIQPKLPVETVDYRGMLEGIPVLIVDDSAVNRDVVSQQLSITGASVHTAENGEAAISLYKKIKPAVVLMDISMPVLDGISATEKIRGWEAIQNIEHSTILALSANVLDDQKSRCFAAGMNGFIPKPSSRDHVLKVIRDSILDAGPTSEAKTYFVPGPSLALPEFAPHDRSVNLPLAPSGSHAKLAEKVVNLDIVAELASSLPPSRFKSILVDLRNEVATLLLALEQSGDVPSLVEDVHKVAGSSGMIGCVSLSESLRDLELCIKRGAKVTTSRLQSLQDIWIATDGELAALMEDA